MLSRMMNACIQTRILLMSTLFLPICQVLSTFLLIRLGRQLGLQGIGLMVIFLGNVVTVLICPYTIAAFINSKSVEVVQKCKGNFKLADGRRSTYTVKCFRACFPLTIRFGNNFVERTTPLIIQNFCFSQVASLLMASKRQWTIYSKAIVVVYTFKYFSFLNFLLDCTSNFFVIQNWVR